MRIACVMLSLMVLTGCGVDGSPITPTFNSTVSIGSEGVRSASGVTLRSGPVTVGAGF